MPKLPSLHQSPNALARQELHELIEKYNPLVLELISAGIEVEKGNEPEIEHLKDESELNCQSYSFWELVSSGLSTEELYHLIKGLTYTENKFRWVGGSVAAVSDLFSAYSIRDIRAQDLYSLATWILANTYNKYIPFGTSVDQYKSGELRRLEGFVKDELRVGEYSSLISQLIEVGKSVEDDFKPAVDYLSHASKINSQSPNFWRLVANDLTTDNLIHLIKGLTFTEKELEWPGGSVSGVILLFRYYEERQVGINNLDKLSSWIIANTHNHYAPFGTMVTYEASSYSEYWDRRNERLAHVAEINAKSKSDAEIHRDWLKFARAESHKYRNTELRTEIQNKLNPMTVEERFVHIVEDKRFAPNFYPTRYAIDATEDVIKKLPSDLVDKLLKKLKGKYRGPWGAFKKRLASI